MDKIYVLGKDGKYEEATVIDEEIKEQVKRNECECRDGRCCGDLQENEGDAGKVAPDAVHRRGEDPVV